MCKSQCRADTWKFLVTFISIFILINFSPLFCMCFTKYSKSKPGMFTLAWKMVRTHRKHIPSLQTPELTPENVIILDREFLHINQKIRSVMRLSLIALCLGEMTVVATWKPQVWKWMCLKAKQNTRLKNSPIILKFLGLFTASNNFHKYNKECKSLWFWTMETTVLPQFRPHLLY